MILQDVDILHNDVYVRVKKEVKIDGQNSFPLAFCGVSAKKRLRLAQQCNLQTHRFLEMIKVVANISNSHNHKGKKTGAWYMTRVTRKSAPLLPKTHDINLAEIASEQMSSFLVNNWKKDIRFSLRRSKSDDVIEFDLTPAVVELIFKTIVHIATGDAVTIVPFHAELTTQEAANFLNVSRPYLIKLLEKERIPVRRIGRHRRILFEDILKYKERSKVKSRIAREQLTQEAQDLGLGY